MQIPCIYGCWISPWHRCYPASPELQKPDIMEGSLAYMSPEQTGRTNRSVDYRSDYYSVGVVFYEMLTGRQPFRNASPLELIHSHLARQVVPPNEIAPNIPTAISDIVVRLMAKTAEERYQSGQGIKADLVYCQQRLEKTGRIRPFILGSKDISEKFKITQKLYGREQEVERLLGIFEEASRGKMEMAMVTGYPGIGKTSLVKEIYKPITQKKGYFISGKFDQYHRNIPYNALVNAFQEFVKQLLTENRPKLLQWRKRLSAALGSDGQVITDVIPDMEIVIGPQAPARPLEAIEARNRFDRIFLSFIRVF